MSPMLSEIWTNVDTWLRIENFDWEEFLRKLQKTEKGYTIKEDDSEKTL